jgi:hypothetical protein
MKMFSHLWQYLAELFLKWKILHINVLEKIKTHYVQKLYFWKLYNVEKYVGVRQAGDDYQTEHAFCTLNK